ncbi:MAG: HemK/PrmC family methyltransferase [candidate division WOR-3 bacterium]
MVEKLSKEFELSVEETELIVSTLLRRPRFELYFRKSADHNIVNLLRMELTQLKNGVPIEYITKQVQFLRYTLKIFPGVFIPRLETEYFVELIVKLIDFVPERVCEIGTGCGAIAIALAEALPQSEIIATDISTLALENARENISLLNFAHRINLIRADMFSAFSKGIFDLIVCNPPYIPTERILSLPKSVRDFEPRNAIDGGFGGIEFIKRIIDRAKYYSVDSKCNVALEIDDDEVITLESYLRNESVNYFFLKDLFGRYRYLFVGNFRKNGE